ncbi:hypothetical protein [Mycolicibacterium sp.]|uniref:hypothetical protein n=1 Tax=Mycolicibacterium sp. TaxID=2320850 RepID=UPI00355D8094
MAALRSLLEVYGALDAAVTHASDSIVPSIVDEFLPGASANTGWYRELETLFFPQNPRLEPNFAHAIAELETTTDEDDPLSAAEKSRLLYATTALCRVHQDTVRPADPKDPESRGKPPEEPPFEDYVARALALLGPAPNNAGDRRDYQERRQTFSATCQEPGGAVQTFLTELPLRMAHRDQFYSFRRHTVDTLDLDPDILDIPVCHASVIDVCGTEAVVVDTECTTGAVSLDKLKKVVNPFNWHHNYQHFFCSMDPIAKPERPDGWRRVLEKVGFCSVSNNLHLCTALKYHLSVSGQDEKIPWARLDYDLDDPCPGRGGDGRVTVDRGYINMWAHNDTNSAAKDGVAVRTRKVVHITGVSPYAQARLVCIAGYGTASGDFLIGAAQHPSNECKEFDHYDTGVPVPAEPAPNPAAAGFAADGTPRPADHAVTTAVKLWTDAVANIGTSYFNLAGRWSAGTLRLADVTKHYQGVTEQLLTKPLEYLETVTQPRYPTPPAETPAAPSSGNPVLREQEAAARALQEQLRIIIANAAADDKAGKWGLDGWIRTIHDLIDLQIRTVAGYLQTAGAGPWFGGLGPGKPWPSEKVFVEPAKFPRRLDAVGFRRVGRGDDTVDSALIEFRPAVLDANADHFRVYLRDECRIGANYTGTVRFTRADGIPAALDPLPVTVGL